MSPLKKGKHHQLTARKLMSSHPALDPKQTKEKQKKRKTKGTQVNYYHKVIRLTFYYFPLIILQYKYVCKLFMQLSLQNTSLKGLKALQAIRQLQSSTRLLMPKSSFGKVVREVLQSYAGRDLR
jgi:hypothetical protein